MKASPIIHTRTFSCDFNATFLVKPESFMDSDIKWARKNVLGATSEIDGLQGMRWLIADNGKYRMAGVVGFLKSICSRCHLTESDRLKSEKLFCDDKGRLVYAFIGVVIDKEHSDEYGSVSLDYLWSLYLREVSPIWKRTYQESILKDFVEIKSNLVHHDFKQPVPFGAKTLYETNSAQDYNLFSQFLCERDKSNFSFCSNLLDFNTVKQSGFTIITTSQNIITRVTRDCVVESSSVSMKKDWSAPVENTESTQDAELKKKHIVALMIGSGILAMIILVLLLIK